MKIDEFLDFFDFSYEKYEDGYGLVDNQGVNLGDIESERYNSISGLVERIADSIYCKDYYEDDMEEEYGYNGDHSIEDEYAFAKANNIPYICIIEAMMFPENVTE